MLMKPSEFYSAGISDRKPYEDRAELIAKVTLPYIIRTDGSSGSTELEDSNAQSYGARLVNTLKAKMGMALLPPSTSSFRFVPNAQELEALSQGSADNAAQIMNLLSSQMIAVNEEIENQQIRPSLFDMILQLIVVGSVVVEKIKDEGVSLHTLKSYIVKLNKDGVPLAICIYEELDKTQLPKGYTPKDDKIEIFKLFTLFSVKDEAGATGWEMTQEIEGEVQGEVKSYKDYNSLPVKYYGWTWMVGDQYHRPYAEDYYKDLEQIDKLAQLLTDGSLVAAKILLFVNERGGRTRKDAVAESGNGDVIDGSAEDVTALQINKNFDFQVPMEREANLKAELASAFLMNESATRQAERVTATEIQFMAQQLETSTLAGIYSSMSLEWSKWIVEKIMAELGIKFKEVEVDILTGLDALGRSQESQKLDNYLARLAQLNMMVWINEAEVASRYAAFEGIETNNLLKTPDEVKNARAQAQQQAATQAGEEALATSAGGAAGEAMVAGAQEQA